MNIRSVNLNDAEQLVGLFESLDHETSFMLFEPGERQLTVEAQSEILPGFIDHAHQAMFVAEDDNQNIAGFVVGIGGKMNRNRHALYLVIGVRQAYQGRGLGRRLISALEQWASAQQFHRLELTVMAHNQVARKLYLSAGFQEEGVKRDALKVDGQFVDEVYMAKFLKQA
ncbi:GNAT family N-acetyltransferase [Photobacterium sp. 1_MG-2023]|uniref:GNAT family N-acetyltransferase n=1 Tax=Photobacterium sp. 1_MG-2023 TaxID=3062646 RepID=UPI0026E440B4|nr:GNAT family N-acetyltransferase [Photobacterium sp. 1_MG-2023]MDO6705598.1 GNAT family N-acetyltransferase [Photobacterium sp. 1_MG-2023]